MNLPILTTISIIFTVGHFLSLANGLGSPAKRILEDGVSAGWRYLSDLDDFELRLIENNIFVKEGSPFFQMAKFKQPRPESYALNKQVLRYLATARNISERLNLLPAEFEREHSFFLNAIDRQSCPAAPTCNATAIYRSADGSCNNLQQPLYGKSGTSLIRLLPPDYSDGISAPRLSSNSTALPSTRAISMAALVDVDSPAPNLSLAVMQWGQFLDHDLDLVPTNTLADGSPIQCCDSLSNFLPANLTHPQCLPIAFPPGDKFNRTCMNFVRSLVGPRPNCTLGAAEQLNEITHWIDGSQIYGSTLNKSLELRNFTGGWLLTSFQSGRYLLPVVPPCTTNDCFVAGDSRAKEQPFLAAMHTIWMREHNRLALQLGKLNPSWNDEKIYQEARRIVIAELQHITYNEWLPIILGSNYTQLYGLQPLTSGYYNSYNPTVNPSITNEFATAAYRMGHSMIQGYLRLYAENGTELTNYDFLLSAFFFNSRRLAQFPDWLDSAIRALYYQPVQNTDNSFTAEVTNKLFGWDNFTSFRNGLDLAAINMQRGRDHGLPSYVKYRQYCGLSVPTSFTDLLAYIPSAVVTKFQNLYKSVNDIDLYVAGISENHAPGSLLGPTFSCIIGQQFSTLKQGDRFYYEIGNQPHSFSSKQLIELRKVTLARIFCDNDDGSIVNIPAQVFQLTSAANPQVPCTSIPQMNLSQWVGI